MPTPSMNVDASRTLRRSVDVVFTMLHVCDKLTHFVGAGEHVVCWPLQLTATVRMRREVVIDCSVYLVARVQYGLWITCGR